MKVKTLDYCDPIQHAEKREEAWDRFAAKLPVCGICHTKVSPGQSVHIAKRMAVCDFCMVELAENVEILEE